MQPLGAPEKAEKTIGNGETFSSCIPKTVEYDGTCFFLQCASGKQ